MALPELVRYKVEKEMERYCKGRIPLHLRDQIKITYSIRGNSVTLFEERPSYFKPDEWTKTTVAQFRYGDDNRWTLYCSDRNDRWHEFIDFEPSMDIQDLLKEVDRDSTGIFWG